MPDVWCIFQTSVSICCWVSQGHWLRNGKKLIQCLKKEAFEQVATAVSKREEVQEHMKVRATNLTAELQTLALDMQENSSSLEKLRPLLENYCEEIDSPSFSMSTSDLRKMIEEAKAEIKDADKFLPSHQRTMISHIEHVNTNHSYPVISQTMAVYIQPVISVNLAFVSSFYLECSCSCSFQRRRVQFFWSRHSQKGKINGRFQLLHKNWL